MLPTIVFHDTLWLVLGYLPYALTLLAGIVLAMGLLGTRGWQPTCRACGHDLRGVESPRCPECGGDLAKRNAVRPGRWAPRWPSVILGLALVAITAATLPPWSWNTEWIRRGLLARLGPQDLLSAASTGKGSRAANEVNRRIAAGDEAFRLAFLDASIGEIEADATGSPPSVRNGLFRQATKSASLDEERRNRLAAVIVGHVTKGDWTPAVAWTLVGSFDRALQEDLLPSLLANDALLLAGITCAPPSSLVVGTGRGVQVAWQVPGMVSFLASTEVEVSKATWRPADAAPDGAWTPIARREQFEFDRNTIMLQFSEPGTRVVRIEGEVVATSPGSAGVRRVPFTREMTIDVVSADSIPLTLVRGGEERTAIEELLKKLTAVGDAGGAIHLRAEMPRLGVSRSRGQKRNEVVFYAKLDVSQGGPWHEFGSAHLAQGSYGIGGTLPPGKIDPTKPFILRMTPDPDAARRSGQPAVVLLDEVAELHYERANQNPASITWPAPATN